MVNKRVAEIFIVCLFCHFGVGKISHHGARGTSVDPLDDALCYNDKNLFWDLS
jgi:hypothetical protein